jgi:alpha-galactosidase
MADVRLPVDVYVLHDDDDVPTRAAPSADASTFATGDVLVELAPGSHGLEVYVSSPDRGLSRVILRWRDALPASALVLGDAWERSYGDLQWRHRQPERVLPWYWLAYDAATGLVRGMGVRVRPRAFASWAVDEEGTTLWLDVRSGGLPVDLGPRRLAAATVVAVEPGRGTSPFEALGDLCEAMCDDPRLPPGPVVGANNWYYAYGEGFGPAEVLRDAGTITELTDGHEVAPFCVVDAGWSLGGSAPGGPWTGGIPGVFDDMAALAADVSARGARPGIWFRPAALSFVDDPGLLRAGPHRATEKPLDLSRPEILAIIAADVRRLVGWGYQLVKHDFSTFDHLGKWGLEMTRELTDPGWALVDRSITNAEVLQNLYRTVREAAGDALVIGCNTVGHLAAGLTDIQRTGDDTSGRCWERSRRMGVNTLAFRLAQHRRFFCVDADCVPCTPATPWDHNRQLLDLVARSGTALFVSVDPRARSKAVDADLRAALRIALDGGEPSGVEPLDWLNTTSPRDWRIGAGRSQYKWLGPYGAGERAD